MYKKPKVTPAKIDPIQQEAFAISYYERRSVQNKDEVMLFMDGVHPAHQTQAVHGYGWIKRGTEVSIQTTSKNGYYII